MNMGTPLSEVGRKPGTALFRKTSIGLYWFSTPQGVADTECSAFLRERQALAGCRCAHRVGTRSVIAGEWGRQHPYGALRWPGPIPFVKRNVKVGRGRQGTELPLL